MQIELTNRQNINLKGKGVIVAPFFNGEKLRMNDFGFGSEGDDFSKELRDLEGVGIRLFFCGGRKLIFYNLGKKEKWTQRKFILTIRKIILFLKENNLKEGVLFLDRVIPQKSDLANLVRQVSENIYLASYEFVRYKKKPKDGWKKIEKIEIIWPDAKKYQKNLREGEKIGQVINFVRDLTNIPGGDMTPTKMASATEIAFKGLRNVKIEIFNKQRIKSLGMGGIMGVSQGSDEEPKLIILKYFGKNKNKKFDLAFVGKAVTFDTGGLDLKPFESLREGMYMDMAGGAAVLGSISALCRIQYPLNIIAVIPVVENMVSGHALRPGDILKSYSGKTIEVVSPDAEGRIILADALAYTIKTYKPKAIIDVATLTGAAVVALGQRAVALFTNMPEKEEILRKIGEDSGDYVWPLPIWEEYEEENRGTFGDIANLGKYLKYGGAINAAMFLESFVGKTPWVHLDIAPTMVSIDGQGLAKGATGTGVRYLIEMAKKFIFQNNN